MHPLTTLNGESSSPNDRENDQWYRSTTEKVGKISAPNGTMYESCMKSYELLIVIHSVTQICIEHKSTVWLINKLKFSAHWTTVWIEYVYVCVFLPVWQIITTYKMYLFCYSRSIHRHHWTNIDRQPPDYLFRTSLLEFVITRHRLNRHAICNLQFLGYVISIPAYHLLTGTLSPASRPKKGIVSIPSSNLLTGTLSLSSSRNLCCAPATPNTPSVEESPSEVYNSVDILFRRHLLMFRIANFLAQGAYGSNPKKRFFSKTARWIFSKVHDPLEVHGRYLPRKFEWNSTSEFPGILCQISNFGRHPWPNHWR